MLHTDSLTAAEPERLITARQISSQEEQLMPAALGVLEELGGDDEVEE